MLEKVILALEVFKKYNQKEYPFRLSYDAIIITEVKEDELTDQEVLIVNEGGFYWSEEFKGWANNESIT